VKDLRDELAKRSGYRAVKLFFHGVVLEDHQMIISLKLFDASTVDVVGRGSRLYYCPIVREPTGHKHQRLGARI